MALVPVNRSNFITPFERDEHFGFMSLETAPADDPSRFLALSKRPEWSIAQEGAP
jgi:hypothetical protein